MLLYDFSQTQCGNTPSCSTHALPPERIKDRPQNQPLTHTGKKNTTETQTRDSVHFSALPTPAIRTHRLWDCFCFPSWGAKGIFQALEDSGWSSWNTKHQRVPASPKQAGHLFPGMERITSKKGSSAHPQLSQQWDRMLLQPQFQSHTRIHKILRHLGIPTQTADAKLKDPRKKGNCWKCEIPGLKGPNPLPHFRTPKIIASKEKKKLHLEKQRKSSWYSLSIATVSLTPLGTTSSFASQIREPAWGNTAWNKLHLAFPCPVASADKSFPDNPRSQYNTFSLAYITAAPTPSHQRIWENLGIERFWIFRSFFGLNASLWTPKFKSACSTKLVQLLLLLLPGKSFANHPQNSSFKNYCKLNGKL